MRKPLQALQAEAHHNPQIFHGVVHAANILHSIPGTSTKSLIIYLA